MIICVPLPRHPLTIMICKGNTTQNRCQRCRRTDQTRARNAGLRAPRHIWHKAGYSVIIAWQLKVFGSDGQS